MKTKSILFAVLLSFTLTTLLSCGNAGKTNSDGDSMTDTSGNMTTDSNAQGDNTAVKSARAEISNTKPDTTGSGTAEFSNKSGGEVEMKLEITFPGMANKTVAVHLHEHGDCGDSGKEAHGHWNPTNEQHGKWGSSAFHSGDIGNVQLNGEGKGTVTLSSNRWSLGGDEKTNILNKAIIVHSGVDDYKTQPTGNAGSRIGCGIIMSSLN